jgi:hypothetical protein
MPFPLALPFDAPTHPSTPKGKNTILPFREVFLHTHKNSFLSLSSSARGFDNSFMGRFLSSLEGALWSSLNYPQILSTMPSLRPENKLSRCLGDT